MRNLGIVASSALKASAPSVTVSSVTNYNQNIGTLNGTVSANGAITTTIKFQVSLNNSTWYDAVGGTAITNTSSDGVSVYYNATGYNNGGSVNFSPGTLYYIRLVATNSVGTTNSSSTSFTTWSLKTYQNGPSGSNDTLSGSQTFTIPTVTPTNGSAIIPSITEILVVGGGGAMSGSLVGGGGGGGYNSESSATFSSTANFTLSLSIGGSGTASSISASNFTTISAGGGGTADLNGGNVGSGDNLGYTGGTGVLYGDPKSGYYANGGGGAGAGGNGSATAQYAAGAGGNGVSVYGYGVSAGGGGTAQNGTNGANGTYWGGYGSGQSYSGGPAIGLVRFKYYAA